MVAPNRLQRCRRRIARRRIARRRLGAACVLVGFGLVGAVAYQLLGTGVVTSHAQAVFRAGISAHGFPRRPVPGGVVGFIRIPRIHLDMAFVQGTSRTALTRGPGHYRQTPLPGQGGNVAIAAHRTTYLHPFRALDRVRRGDRIALQTRMGTFVYRVVWRAFVPPGSWWVIGPTNVPSLTLTTCNPPFCDAGRLVVRAIQVYGPAPGGFIDELAHHSQP